MGCAFLFFGGVSLSEGHAWLPTGPLLAAFSPILFAGESNAVNLTDGVDGLAAGTFAIAATALAMRGVSSGGACSVGLACQSMGIAGSACGFLAFNRHPAKVFMGDTGSLALGAFLAAHALRAGLLASFLVVTAPFNWEMLSVILQVGWFKWTKKAHGKGTRLFRMAPFHHHLERAGWSEPDIVRCFYAAAAISGAIALALPSA